MFPLATRILVVDDMSTMRKLISKLLRELGFQSVAEAGDGDEAWKKIQAGLEAKTPIELVISDWNMPKMKGIELLAKVRDTTRTAGVAFVLVTAESEMDSVAEAAQARVNGYLLKPFSKDQLAAVLEAASQKKKVA